MKGNTMFRMMLMGLMVLNLAACEEGGSSAGAASAPVVDDGSDSPTIPSQGDHDLVIDFLNLDAELDLYAEGRMGGPVYGPISPDLLLSQDGTGLRVSGQFSESFVKATSAFQINMQSPFSLELRFRINKGSISHDDRLKLRFIGENGQKHELVQEMRANEGHRLFRYAGTQGVDPTDSEGDGDYCFCRQEELPGIFSFNNSADVDVTLKVSRDINGQTIITGNYGEGDFVVYPDSSIQPDWSNIELTIEDEGDDSSEGMDITLYSLTFDGEVR